MHKEGSQKFLEIREEMLKRREKGQTVRKLCKEMGFKSVSAYYYYTKNYKLKMKSREELIECLKNIQREVETSNNLSKIKSMLSDCLD